MESVTYNLNLEGLQIHSKQFHYRTDFERQFLEDRFQLWHAISILLKAVGNLYRVLC